MLFDVHRPKGKPPVGGVSIFGAITDELTGGRSPESSTVTTKPLWLPPYQSLLQ